MLEQYAKTHDRVGVDKRENVQVKDRQPVVVLNMNTPRSGQQIVSLYILP